MGPGSHTRSRRAVPAQGWHPFQISAAGPPAPSEQGRDTSPSAEAGEAALGAAFRGRAGGRMWSEAIISLTLPGDPLLLPAPLPRAALSPPGDPSARRAVTAARREGRGQRRPSFRGVERGETRPAVPLLQIPGQHRRGSPHPDGCVRTRGCSRCPPYLPRAFTGRTETYRRGCPAVAMLPPCPGRGGAPSPP